MKSSELNHILAAILILSIVAGFSSIINGSYSLLPQILLFSAIIISVNLASKKMIAYWLDSDVEHEIWKSTFSIYEKPSSSKEKPAGIIIPLIITLLSLGAFKLPAILTYEARALKHRAAKRFGYYSYTEMTDWHNSLIGAAGIISLLLLSIITYFAGSESLAKLSIFYAFANILPISKLDGTQIYFGSKQVYAALAAITLIFTLYAIFLI